MVSWERTGKRFLGVLFLSFLFLGGCSSSRDKSMSGKKGSAETFEARAHVAQGAQGNREGVKESLRAESMPSSSPRPNIIFVLTDDLAVWDLEAMPKLKALITDQGTSFSNFFVNLSQCCPSRASILRGQYAHNTEIYGNYPPEGGFQKFHSSAKEISTVAVWLHDAGYRTMLAGKYLNGYPTKHDLRFIPPGWDEWYSPVKGDAYGQFNYTLNENGTLVHYGHRPKDYGTDVYRVKSTDFIRRMAKEGKPFFCYLSVYAPHTPATPAPRHMNLFPDARAPRTPNFNEEDVSDKPRHIRSQPLLSAEEIRKIDEHHRKRLQSLQAVDEMIEDLLETLTTTGQIENTYIFFSSDNGFHLGNHRQFLGKQSPYEEEMRVPLLVRGPGVARGRQVDLLTGNIDLAPTWAELAGVKIPDWVDGFSLVPLWSPRPLSSDSWRHAYLLQCGNPDETGKDSHHPIAPTWLVDGTLEPPDDIEELRRAGFLGDTPKGVFEVPPFYGIRTAEYTYIEYVTGERELYDLRRDPYQLENKVERVNPELVDQLSARVRFLKKCAGYTCRNEPGE
jgi:N-acetylglucosamine-6-sulfatase